MTERVPIIAAVGVLAAIVLGGGFMLLGRGQSSPGAVSTQPALVRHAKPTAQEAKRVLKTKKHRTPAVINGMPAALALALRAHPVVVVSLYAPDASVDALAKEEGRQGAALAGAGFVALDVSNEKVASALTSLLTTGATAADRVLDDPAVLVFRRPNALFVRLNGWTDRELVAQAASNAASGS